MKTTSERHQYCFSFMRSDTGGQKTKTFWGNGNPDEALVQARDQAQRFRDSYESELNTKARDKARARGEYRPSYIHVDIVGRSMWR